MVDFNLSGGRGTRFTITVPSVNLEFDKKLIRRILGQAGREIAKTAKALIGRGGGGRRYGKHVASAADGPPSSLSGALARGLAVRARGDRVTISDTASTSQGGRTAFYAVMLEAGAKGGGGRGHGNIGRVHRKGGAKGTVQTKRDMAPRPFLSTAAEGEMPRLEKRIQAALASGIDLKVLKGLGQ